MLKRNSADLMTYGQESAVAPEPSKRLELSRLLGMARRQWLLVIAIALVAVGMAAGYLLVAEPMYQAKAQVLLDTRKIQLFQQAALVQDATFDAPAVESQMEVIRSESIGTTVVDALRLGDDPEFTGGGASPVQALIGRVVRRFSASLADRIGGPVAVSPADRTRAAIFHLRSNLYIQRIRSTYVIEIGFNSLDAGKAARVANAVADTYILEQTQSKQYTTRRAMNWLEERMGELRNRAVDAEKAVQDFRTKNNLVRVGNAVVNEGQLADLTSRQAQAREQTAEAKLRLSRLQEIMTSAVPDAAMSTWLGNDVINKLRGQYVDATRREAELIARLGPNHEAVVKAKKEQQQIERSAAEELRRISQTLKAELEAAQSRELATAAALREAQTRNEGSRQEQGALQMLESTSKTYQGLHDTFLQRYVEATTQQNFQNSEARVISPASNGRKIQPNPQQVLAMGGMLGLALGMGAAFARERFHEVLRTPKEAERALGVECLGVLPALDPRPQLTSPDLAMFRGPGGRVIPTDLGITRQVLNAPFSRFTETMRGIKVAADTSGILHRVIGVTSAVPGEGKSTVAANLAQLAAQSGSRTLLIDADLRQPSLTKSMSPGAETGLLEVLDGTTPLTEALWRDPASGLDFVPAVVAGSLSYSSEVLAGRGMVDFLARVREMYDYIIVDFPPLSPVVDAKAAGHLMDGFVLVVEWGQTSQAVVSEAVASAGIVQSKLLGVVLNRADPAALRQLESYKGKRYHRYYTPYTTA